MTQINKVLANHPEIRRRVAEMRQMEEPLALGQAVLSLAASLKEHFAAEENDNGFFDYVRKVAPRKDHLVKDLILAHSKMLETIGQLTVSVRAGEDLLAPSFRDPLHGLLREIEDHEAIETRMLRDVVSDQQTTA